MYLISGIYFNEGYGKGDGRGRVGKGRERVGMGGERVRKGGEMAKGEDWGRGWGGEGREYSKACKWGTITSSESV